MNSALYQITIELKNGATWTEEVWAQYRDEAEIRAMEFCKGAGQKPGRIIATEVLARS